MSSIQARIQAFETGKVVNKDVGDEVEELESGWIAAPPLPPRYTYPPPTRKSPPKSPPRASSSSLKTPTAHAASTSVSSLHSVDMDEEFERVSNGGVSISSFEQVSPMNERPKLPERRRQAPPPPPRRPSSSSKPALTTRPTPIPASARTRYLRVFDGNLSAPKQPSSLSPPRTRQGWRGLSVDLTTTADPPSPTSPGFDVYTPKPAPPPPGLPNEVVRRIWELSRLPKGRLREIWADCVGKEGTAVGREQFVLGMWRIDEELRRRMVRRRT